MKSVTELIREAVFRGAVVVKWGDGRPRCQAGKFGGSTFHQCTNTGKTKRGKHWFCGVCDPIAREEKRRKREAAWVERWRRRDADIERSGRIRAAEERVIAATKAWCLSYADREASALISAVNDLIEQEKT